METIFFGQCWTTECESDALWRIYAPKKDGILIRSTPKKLLTKLYGSKPDDELRWEMGKINYLKEKDIVENSSILFNQVISDTSGRECFKSLLIKREAFRYESEVRLLYQDLDNDCKEDIIKFEIKDINDVFDQITIDSRMSKFMCENFIQIAKDAGFEGEVTRSTLYEVPNLVIPFQ